jgi:hypothetical protein
LLNAVGETLKPRVLAVSQLKNTGAGSPDAGLFAAHQIPKGASEPLPGQLPERGAVEDQERGRRQLADCQQRAS